ncbi:hypothetical protein UlMin_001910 [Ulmus minor]
MELVFRFLKTSHSSIQACVVGIGLLTALSRRSCVSRKKSTRIRGYIFFVYVPSLSFGKIVMAEIESFLKSLEDEKAELEKKVVLLSEELLVERDRVLRISADFDNFRKRTDRERSSLVTNAQGEVVESLLSVLDNFERAKAQIKVETEGEEKINNSYQSIYKQFMEILTSLGVVPVETIGKPFDPLNVPPPILHRFLREHRSEWADSSIDACSATAIKEGPCSLPVCRAGCFGHQDILPLAHTIEHKEVRPSVLNYCD